MMNPSKRTYNCLLLVILLFLAACVQNAKDTNSQPAENVSCMSEMDSIANLKIPPSDLSRKLQALYVRTNGPCREKIARKLMMKLFNILYASPKDSTGIPQFFKKMSEGETDENTKLQVMLVRTAYYLYIVNSNDSAKYCLKGATEKQATFDDTVNKTYFSLLARLDFKTGNPKLAAKHYQKAIKYSEKIKDSVSVATNSGNLGSVYSELGDYDKAITMRKRTTKFFEDKGNDPLTFIGYVGIGSSYERNNMTDSALFYYDKSLELIKKGVKDPSNALVLYINLGEIYSNKAAYAKARQYFDLAKEMVTEIGSPEQEISYTLYSMPAYAQIRDVTPEINKALGYIPKLKKENNLIVLKEVYYFLYKIAEMKKQHVAALDYYKRFNDVVDEMGDLANRKYLSELETKYATQKKQALIEKQEVELEKRTAVNQFLIAILVAGILAVAFAIARYRLLKNKRAIKTQEFFTHRLLENSEEERGRIARDLHDGVSQELLLLKNQVKSNPVDAPKTIDGIINEIRMISRQLHPVMLSQIGLKESILHIVHRIMESGKIFITAEIDYPHPLPKKSELQLFRIIQEAINNLIKYAGAEAAKVRVYEEQNMVITEIVDNGSGFDVQNALQGNTSFGLLSIVERSKSVGGRAEISAGSDGTKVKISIPLQHD